MSVWGKPVIVDARFAPSIYNAAANPIEQGNIASASGQDTTNNYNTRLRTNGYIAVTEGRAYRIDTNVFRVYCYFYDSTQAFLTGQSVGWVTPLPDNVTVPAGAAYMRMVLAKSTGNITPEDVTRLTIRPAQNSMIYIS